MTLPLTKRFLAQLSPVATTLSILYTVPSPLLTNLCGLEVANRAGSASTYRLALSPLGAAAANEQYLAYDIAIAANDTHHWTFEPGGILLMPTDIIRVYSGNGSIAFTAHGRAN